MLITLFLLGFCAWGNVILCPAIHPQPLGPPCFSLIRTHTAHTALPWPRGKQSVGLSTLSLPETPWGGPRGSFSLSKLREVMAQGVLQSGKEPQRPVQPLPRRSPAHPQPDSWPPVTPQLSNTSSAAPQAQTQNRVHSDSLLSQKVSTVHLQLLPRPKAAQILTPVTASTVTRNQSPPT